MDFAAQITEVTTAYGTAFPRRSGQEIERFLERLALEPRACGLLSSDISLDSQTLPTGASSPAAMEGITQAAFTIAKETGSFVFVRCEEDASFFSKTIAPGRIQFAASPEFGPFHLRRHTFKL